MAGAVDVAKPGSLEFFLAERYLLCSETSEGLATGRVFHEPYPLTAARLTSYSESLIGAVGIEPSPPTHAFFSPGVDVEVICLKSDERRRKLVRRQLKLDAARSAAERWTSTLAELQPA